MEKVSFSSVIFDVAYETFFHIEQNQTSIYGVLHGVYIDYITYIAGTHKRYILMGLLGDGSI